MNQYETLLKYVYDNGIHKTDRTGIGTKSIFGYQIRFDLSSGFPLVTTKKVHVKSIIYELLWFLKGETNIKYLRENGVTIWDEWADKNGELGPVYGYQWRMWEAPDGRHIDQISKVIQEIKSTPFSRRLIVSAWNVADIEKMSLPSCHAFFQFNVANGNLSCHMYQRSADLFLGVPFNIASFSLLTMMIAQVCELKPGELIISFGDAHIYNNHFEQVKTQLAREPRTYPLMQLNPQIKDIFSFRYEDFSLIGYNPHPPIKADIAV